MSTKKKTMKTKSTYDPFTALHPVSLRPELEDLARELYQLACRGSEPLWEEIKGLEDGFKGNPDLQRNFSLPRIRA